jgi:two-component system phosphate regulon sensor histidine kinase PhoR
VRIGVGSRSSSKRPRRLAADLAAARDSAAANEVDMPIYEQALTALGRSEAILEGVADGIYITDPSGQIRLWNRAAQRLIGCRESKALGHGCAEVLRLETQGMPLDCSQGCALLRMHNGDPTLPRDIEASRDAGGGKHQRLLVGASAVLDREGNVTEIVHSLRDITAIRQADEAKTMFLSTASHELKTPLTVILGFAQLLLEDSMSEENQRTALEAIEKRAKELSRIVDRLLMTGRIESGRIVLTLGHVCPREILPERAVALATATERNIVCEVPEDIPLVVGDAEAIATVVDHLLDNAVKYSPDGGDIVLRAAKRGRHIDIEVSDSGIGMSPIEAAHCFDSFWQAEASDVRRFGGTGIGLYIVKSLVEGMGGTISVRSAPGRGSTFTVSLSRAREGAIPPGVVVPQKPTPGEGKASMIQEFMRQLGVPPVQGGGA